MASGTRHRLHMEAAADSILAKDAKENPPKKRRKAKGENGPSNQVRACSTMIFNLKGVAEVLIEAGLNPAEEILRVMPLLDPTTQAKLHAELLQYVQPKLKSIELTGKNGGPIEQAISINVGFVSVTD